MTNRASPDGRLPPRGWPVAVAVLLAVVPGANTTVGQIADGPDQLQAIHQPLPADDWLAPDRRKEHPDESPGPRQLGVPSPDWDAAWAFPGDATTRCGARCGPLPVNAARSLRPLGDRVGGRLLDVFRAPLASPAGFEGPATCESWRYRPLSAGWFMGIVQGSPLIDDWVGGKQGFFAGYRLGWDYADCWGCEMRFSFGNVELYDRQRAKEAQRAADDALGLAPDDPFRRRFDRRRDATVGLWDIDLLYYPWGDTAWRPYCMAGLGTARIEFIDRLSTRYRETAFGLPLAIGVKYRPSDWIALRLECADNIAFGDDLETVHHVSLTAGMEIRFGGSRVAYWPWNPGRHYW